MEDLINDAYRTNAHDDLIGEDLTEEALIDLHLYFTGKEGDSPTAAWWEDKAHQLGYRLLLRLIRAEAELKALKTLNGIISG
jgi:phage gp46-like protein